MAKIEKRTGASKTDIDNIIQGVNVRKSYKNIEERARSIEHKGQLQPIILQRSKEEPGKFNMVTGYTRLLAHYLLVKEGKPFNQIEYVIKTGDPLTIQLAENIQRENLSNIEIENALKEMIDTGLKAEDIILALDKPKQWVSDGLAAQKIRAKIKIDTSLVSSSAFRYLRKTPIETINKIMPGIVEKGGSIAAVKYALKELEEPTPETSEPAPEGKEPVKEKIKTVKAQNSAPAPVNPYSTLYAEIDKLVNSGHNKEQIIEKINIHLG